MTLSQSIFSNSNFKLIVPGPRTQQTVCIDLKQKAPISKDTKVQCDIIFRMYCVTIFALLQCISIMHGMSASTSVKSAFFAVKWIKPNFVGKAKDRYPVYLQVISFFTIFFHLMIFCVLVFANMEPCGSENLKTLLLPVLKPV